MLGFGPISSAPISALPGGAAGPASVTLAGSAQVVATATGSFPSAVTLAGNAQVVASSTPNLRVGVALASNAAVIATTTPNVVVGVRLAAAPAGVAAATGQMNGPNPLAATAQVVASASGILLNENITLAGSAVSVASAATILESGIGDPHWNKVVFLSSMEGTNGSTTFTDKAIDPHTINGFGGASILVTSGVVQTSALNLVAASSQYVEALETSTEFSFGSGDFTIEFWANMPLSGTRPLIYLGNTSGFVAGTSVYIYSSNNVIFAQVSDGSSTVTARVTNNADSLIHHYAFVRRGTVLNGYRDGVVDSLPQNCTLTLNSAVDRLRIGTNWNSSGSFHNGLIDEIRITKGVARYGQSSFAALPLSAFPASQPPLQLIGLPVSLATATAALSTPKVLQTQPQGVATATATLLTSGTGAALAGDAAAVATATATAGSIYALAVTAQAVATVSQTIAKALNMTSAPAGVAAATGNIVKIIPVASNAQAVASSTTGLNVANNSTDPNWTSTILLLHGEANGLSRFVDDSFVHRQGTALGGATLSGSIYQAGVSSLYFPLASNSGLTFPITGHEAWGASDFTVEGWVRFAQAGGTIVTNFNTSAGSNFFMLEGYDNVSHIGISFTVKNAGVSYQVDSTFGGNNPNIAPNTWNHIAVVRSGATLTMYVGGISRHSVAIAGSLGAANNGIRVGCRRNTNNTGETFDFDGYIDELRISKVARYTSTFTPSVTPFPDWDGAHVRLPTVATDAQGVATATPNLQVLLGNPLAATPQVVATATGTLTTQSGQVLTGNAQAVASATGAVDNSVKSMAVAAQGVAVAAGALAGGITIAADAVVAVVGVGGLAQATRLNVSSAGVSTTTGNINVSLNLTAAPACAALLVGPLSIGIRMAATPACVALAVGDLSTVKSSAAVAPAVAAAVGGLAQNTPLAGTALIVSTATGITTVGLNILASAPQGVATATGDLSRTFTLAGDAQSTSTGSANILLAQALTLAALAQARGSAALVTGPTLGGNAAGVTLASASLSAFFKTNILRTVFVLSDPRKEAVTDDRVETAEA